MRRIAVGILLSTALLAGCGATSTCAKALDKQPATQLQYPGAHLLSYESFESQTGIDTTRFAGAERFIYTDALPAQVSAWYAASLRAQGWSQFGQGTEHPDRLGNFIQKWGKSCTGGACGQPTGEATYRALLTIYYGTQSPRAEYIPLGNLVVETYYQLVDPTLISCK